MLGYNSCCSYFEHCSKTLLAVRASFVPERCFKMLDYCFFLIVISYRHCQQVSGTFLCSFQTCYLVCTECLPRNQIRWLRPCVVKVIVPDWGGGCRLGAWHLWHPKWASVGPSLVSVFPWPRLTGMRGMGTVTFD